ncbi:hypothetical protein HDU85_007585 [Gaertneriomyces sp. JEL0708]|nr:hypothetical protein HDU85_007585 [Gaertneriomyces sp. JEL0708]
MLAVLIYTRTISPGLMMENNVCAALWDKHWCLAAIYPIKMAADIIINSFFIMEVRNVINESTNKGAAIRSIFVSSEIRLLLMFAFDMTSIIIGMTTLDAATDLMFYIATMWVDSTLLTASVFAKDIGHAIAGVKDTSIETPKRTLKSSGGGKQSATLAPEKSGFSEPRRLEA